MSVIVAVCVLVLALLIGVAIDDIGVRTPQKARRNGVPLDAWQAQQGAPMQNRGLFDRETNERE